MYVVWPTNLAVGASCARDLSTHQLWRDKALAHKRIIELLDEISRSPITKTAHYKEFENKIGNAIGNKRWKKSIFDSLVERKVVELGLYQINPICSARSLCLAMLT